MSTSGLTELRRIVGLRNRRILLEGGDVVDIEFEDSATLLLL
jgi:hypothetical protein